MGLSCPTAGSSGCCGTPRRWRAPPSSRSTWRRCSTGSCSTSSSCSTGCCTSPASRSRTAPRRQPAGWRSGASRRSRPGRAPWISSATAWPNAIAHLGTGFLRHPANHRLREDLDADLFKRALLRLVYRLLFWFVAEDRDVLLHPDADQTARTRYQKYYSAARLRTSALRRIGTAHGDLWRAVRLVLERSRRRERAAAARPDRSRRHLRRHRHRPDPARPGAVQRAPARRGQVAGPGLRQVRQAMAAGGLPEPRRRGTRLDLRVAAGAGAEVEQGEARVPPRRDCPATSARAPAPTTRRPRSSTACWTPRSTRSSTTRRSGPRWRRPTRAPTRRTPIADALLAVTVCDPACGSGHFLVAAARRIAKRLAAVREHNPEPTVEALRTALRDVVEALHLRRRPEPDGRRAGQGLAVAGGARTRQAARLPRRPHQVRQRADRGHPGAYRQGHPRQGVQARRG